MSRGSIHYLVGARVRDVRSACILLAGLLGPDAAGTAGEVSLAIVDAQMSREQLGSYADAAYVWSFAHSLDTDVQRLLVAKGLRVTGPFDSFDGMTFPEKKAADLAFVPRILLEIGETYTLDAEQPAPFGGRSVKRQGHLSVRGFVELMLIEPLSEQKMWVKKVELAPASDTVDVDLLMDANGTLNPFHNNTDNRDTALILLLNESYPRILDALWRYLDGEEIAYLAKEAKDARQRKTY